MAKKPKEKYTRLTYRDRMWINCLRSREASRFLMEVFKVRCHPEWLRALPAGEGPRVEYWKNGDRCYMRGHLQDWADTRRADQWTPLSYCPPSAQRKS